MELFNKARPIPEVIQDERTPPRIKALLEEIQPIKKFGELNGLKPTVNYTEYVKLDRNAAVWVVSACEPLRFKSKEWSFPIVGSFPYLGWFDLNDAKEYATDLRHAGWDVDVRGAGAYSTLGWFRDAVLSTMIPDGKDALGDLANVVLHESVHATLYIRGQAFFNESIASFVADHLTLTFLAQAKGPESAEKKAYIDSQNWSKQVEKKMHEAYEKLAALYSTPESDSEKLKTKYQVLKNLKEELHFRRDLNNATLIQFKEYSSGGKEFGILLQRCGGDWKKFLTALSTLNPESFSMAQQEDLRPVLQPLVDANCPAKKD